MSQTSVSERSWGGADVGGWAERPDTGMPQNQDQNGQSCKTDLILQHKPRATALEVDFSFICVRLGLELVEFQIL